MRPHEEGRPAGNGAAEAQSTGRGVEQHQSTGSVVCRRDCILACPVIAPWIAEPGPAGIAWQIAFQLHGLPDPLPTDEYAEAFRQIIDYHGVDALVAGLRRAASIPSAHGSGVKPDRFAALADRYAAAARKGVAA